SQALDESCSILRSTQRADCLDIGDAQRRVFLAQDRHKSLCFLQPASKGMACRRSACGPPEVRPMAQCQFWPCDGLVISARQEMRLRSRTLHGEKEQIDRAEPHSARQVLDRNLRLAEPAPHPAAVTPRFGRVRVEPECSIDEGGAILDLLVEISQRKS